MYCVKDRTFNDIIHFNVQISKTEKVQILEFGGIHFLRRRPRGRGGVEGFGSQISTLLNSLI